MGRDSADRSTILSLTTDIVSAYVGNNSIADAELPAVIKDVFGKLNTVGRRDTELRAELVPAVPVKRSVSKNDITCLDCGKKFKVLKRHLKVEHGLTPDDYRKKWGLGYDYPIIAASYSEVRKKVAREIGLGRKSGAAMSARLKKA